MTETDPVRTQAPVTVSAEEAEAQLQAEMAGVKAKLAQEAQQPQGSRLFPAMAVYPIPGIYDPPQGGSKMQGTRRPLRAGDGIVVIDSDGSHMVVTDASGNLWTLMPTEVRIMVSIPWVGSLMEAANGFAIALDPAKANPVELLQPDKRIVAPNGKPIA